MLRSGPGEPDRRAYHSFVAGWLGGYCVWGKQAPAASSLAGRFLPIGLAQNVTLVRDVAVGQVLTRDDVALDDGALEVRFRGEMEAAFGG